MKSLLALALLALFSLPAHASNSVEGDVHCEYKEARSGRIVFNKTCHIRAGVIGVDGPAFWELTYTSRSQIRVELPLDSSQGTVNGRPAEVSFVGSLIYVTEEATGDLYVFETIAM